VSALAGSADFSAAYAQVKDLRRAVAGRDRLDPLGCVRALRRTLADDRHKSQANARFLYLESARALAELAATTDDSDLAGRCVDGLMLAAGRSNEKALLAATEAMGCLPMDMRASDVDLSGRPAPRRTTIDRLVAASGREAMGRGAWLGRTFALPLAGGETLAVKTARKSDTAADLRRETAWIERLAECTWPERFDLPRPVRIRDDVVFLLTGPGAGPRHAICFVAPPGYYDYLNDHRPDRLPGPREFLAMLERNARLLGLLAAMGVMHTAPIPLFHNRVQAYRRSDEGRYEWHRLGRLDRWLDSALYPNLGASGLRDFEHLQAIRPVPKRKATQGRILDSPALYYRIGEQVLSLLLVAGSYFRARDIDKRGLDENGRPVDARELFDHGLLAEAVRASFTGYYRGFVGRPFSGDMPADAMALAERMIQEMGLDRHMAEYLRVQDQLALTPERFRNLLVDGGYRPHQADKVERGKEDVELITGPHLGDFNSRTSLPELSLFAASAAGVCVGARFAELRSGTGEAPAPLKRDLS
jgi:hypothetical protein